MNKFNYVNITPFKWFVLENFPFIEDDFDALTNWQLFCKIGKEINRIIASQNEVGQEMENVVNAFINLQNFVDTYFENLDVQDEIDHKLDEMVQDGTIENILYNYANVTRYYDTTTAMLEDYANLNVGMKIKTYGYYSVGDGGDAEFYIVDTADENKYQFDLDNGLYANIIFEDNINVLKIGTPANGEDDDSSYIQKAIDFAYKSSLPVYLPSRKNFLIGTTLKLITLGTLRIYGDITQNKNKGFYCNIVATTDVFTVENYSGNNGQNKRTKVFIENLAIKCLDGSTNNNYALFKNCAPFQSVIKNNLFYGFGYIWYNGAIGFVTQVYDNHFREIKKCFMKINDGTSAHDYLPNDSYIHNNYINADRSTNAIVIDGILDDDFEIYENYIDYFMYFCTFTSSNATICQVGNVHHNVITGGFRFGNKLTRGHICENVFEGYVKNNMPFTNPTSMMTNCKFGPFVFEDNDKAYDPDYNFALYQSELFDNVVGESCDYFVFVVLANASTVITRWRSVHEKGTIVKERTTSPRLPKDVIKFYVQTSYPIYRTTHFETLNYSNLTSISDRSSYSYVDVQTAETVTFSYFVITSNMFAVYNNKLYATIINSSDQDTLLQISNES